LCHQLRRDLLLWVLMVFSSLVFDPFLLFLLLHHQSLFVSLLQVREVTSEYLRKKNRHMFVEVKFKRKNILFDLCMNNQLSDTWCGEVLVLV
jgi:hypothetical protein